MVVNCGHLGRIFFFLRFTVCVSSFSLKKVGNTSGKSYTTSEGMGGMGMRGARRVR